MTANDPSRIRRCANRCFFCFVEGLPEGLRPSLYTKDDDVLHSFLFGNFITLTNFRQADWERMEERRLSPLFVSVHTTDLDLRRRMLGNPKAPDILEQLRRVGSLRIQIHAQVVLCPGVNDGDHLAKTIEDLAAIHPTVQSIAVVPVGITRHTIERKGDAVSRHTPSEAANVIEQVAPLQKRFRREIGVSLAYLADEFYIMAGAPIPSAASYDGFPQLGNGIGMTRKLREEWRYLKRKLRRVEEGTHAEPGLTQLGDGGPHPNPLRAQRAPGQEREQDPLRRERELAPTGDGATLNPIDPGSYRGGEGRSSGPRHIAAVCGTLIAPTLFEIVGELSQSGLNDLELVPVVNEFFGPTVTVSGLLTGSDIISALRQRNPIDLLVLPRNMLDSDGERFLDGLTPSDIKHETGADVAVASNLRELIAAVCARPIWMKT